MPIINNFGGIDKEIYNIGDILHKVGKNYSRALPIVCNENGEDFEDYRIYGANGGVGDDTSISNYADIDTGNTYYTDGSDFALPPEAEGASLLSWFFEPSIDYAASENVWRIRGNFRDGTYAYAFYPPSPSFSNTWEISSDNPLDSVTIRKRAITAGSIKIILTKNGAEPGYEMDMSVSDGTTSTTIPIYIGSSPLEENEYVDYNSGKIYKYKQVHSDTVTIDGIEWDILGYDHDTVYKSDNTLAQHSVTIQTHNVLSDMQFDAREALFAFENGLAAGTYHFTVGQQPWYAGDVGKTIQFTLTQAVPAGGQLVVNNAFNATMIGSTISAFASGTATTATETVTMSEGSEGADLGTVNNAGKFASGINSIQRALLGSSRWSTSAIRQYLNSDAAVGEVWTPQTPFDRPPTWATNTAGFLNGVDSDFIAVLGSVQKVTALNIVCDGGGTETLSEKVFLLSQSEAYGGDIVTGGEGTPYAYYSEYSDLPSAGTGADSNRIKYRNGTAKYGWLRSPDTGSTGNVRSVSPSGTLGSYSGAAGSHGVAPACCIPLDDIANNDWLRGKFLKPIDPPVPLPSIPTVNGKTIVSYAGTGTAPEKTWFSGMEFEIEDVYFGDKHIFSVWGEYEGTLPAQFNANGDYLADYRIYGAAGGVGDRTVNLFDYSILANNRSLNLTTGLPEAFDYRIATLTPIDVSTFTSVTLSYQSSITNTMFIFALFNGSTLVSRVAANHSGDTIDVSGGDNLYISFYSQPENITIDKVSNIMLTEGSTAPAEYVPFGYEMDMSVSGGTTATTTPIYIGSEPLNAYEYIDYASGKIYRWSSNQLSVPEVREKTNEEVTCTVSNDGVYTLTVSDTVQSDRILSFSYNPVETPDGKTWIVAAFAENILSNNGMVTLGDAIHPVASAYIRNNGYNVNIAANPSATTYILDRMAITVRAGTPAGTFTLRPMLMYIEPTDPPVPLPALPTVDGTTITDYAGQSAAVPSKFVAKYRKEGF